MSVVQPVWLKQFRGVCQLAIPDTIAMGYLEDALNYEIDENGSLAPRTGFRLLASTATPDAKPIRKIAPADWDGTVRIIVATTHSVYEYIEASDTWALIYTIPTTTADRMTFALLNAATSPTLVFGNGTDPMQKWTGSGSSVACADAPNGRPIEYKNYLAVFGIIGKPGRVQFSINPGDPDTWTYGGVARFVEMRGTVTGIFSYSGLMIFTNTRTAIFYGDPDLPTALTTLCETTGLVSHEACTDCGGSLVWLSQQGVVTWNGSGVCPTQNLSNPDQSNSDAPLSSIDLSKIAWDHPECVSGLYDAYGKRFWLSCKTQGTAIGEAIWRTYIYDLSRSSWFPWDSEVSAMASVVVMALNNRECIIAGTETGELRIHVANQMTDDKVGVQTEYGYWAIQPDNDFGDPNKAKIIRGITIGSTGTVGEIETGQKTIMIVVKGEFSRLANGSSDIDINAGGFLLGVGILDNDAGTGGGTPLGEGEKYHEKFTPLALRSKHFSFVFSGQGTTNAAAISAIGYHVKPGPVRTMLVKE